MDERGNILTLKRNGVVVAEAQLFIHDDTLALRTLLESWPQIASEVGFEILNAVTVACTPALYEQMGPQGIFVDLEDK